jgi:aspartyl-tRNA(Asn)/glutamyl-tRNA(Gln) amidotransferase subunit C
VKISADISSVNPIINIPYGIELPFDHNKKLGLRINKSEYGGFMTTKKQMTIDSVKRLGTLAKLEIPEASFPKLLSDLRSSFSYIDTIQSLDTSKLSETSQVTGLENVFRDDVIDVTRQLTQDEVLSTVKNSQNGFVKVSAIFSDHE